MGVVIGVDVHKSTHTLVVVDPVGRKLAEKSVEATGKGHDEAMRWALAGFGADVVWGVEDCRSLTARLERDLLSAGLHVVRVPPHLMSRSRDSSRQLGKSDPIDALAVARVVLREPHLPVAAHDEASMQLQLLVRRRDDLVGQRTATINRFLGRVHQLDPGHKTPANWDSGKARTALHTWLQTQVGLLAELAHDELDDIDRLTRMSATLERRIAGRVREMAPALVAMPGCGELTAATIVSEVADIRRFRSEAAFARYVGVAPLPHWSGDNKVYRAARHGNRQLNRSVHVIARVQIRCGGPGKAYFHRRLAEGDNPRRAMQALKRHVTRTVYSLLLKQARGEAIPPSRRLTPPARLPDTDQAHKRHVGRPPALDPPQVAWARQTRDSGEPMKNIAVALGVSQATVYRLLALG